MGKNGAFPEKDFYETLRKRWDGRRTGSADSASPEAFWEERMGRGGAGRKTRG